MKMHCTRVKKNGEVEDWTQDTETGDVQENPDEAKEMKEYMDKIRPPAEL